MTKDGRCSRVSVSREIPTSSNPCSLYLLETSTNRGISSRQGGHHVAKKLITTGFPRRFDDWTMLPLMSLSEKGGAFAPGLGVPPNDVPTLPAWFSLCVHRESGKAIVDA